MSSTPNLFDAPVTPTRSDVALPKPVEEAVLPAVLEYTPVGERSPWRVERAEELWARFQLDRAGAAETMKWLHECLHSFPLWVILRRLFGIAPVIPSAEMSPEDLRPWPASELCDKLGLTHELLEAQIEACRSHWEGWQKRQAMDSGETRDSGGTPGQRRTAGTAVPPQAKEELTFTDEEALREFGFHESMFELQWNDGTTSKPDTKRRPAEENEAERRWFAQLVQEHRKMLTEVRGGASSLARKVLLNELAARRLESDMVKLRPSSRDWEDLRVRKNQLEQTITEQHEKLATLFPELGVAGKVTFRQSIGDLVRGEQMYYGHADNRLVDKIRTVAELDWLTRQSLQIPTARMRRGQDVAILSAIEGMYDPNWRPWLPHHVLKKLDAAAQAAIESARQGNGEQLIDLEKDGEEFPDFQVNEEKEEEKG